MTRHAYHLRFHHKGIVQTVFCFPAAFVPSLPHNGLQTNEQLMWLHLLLLKLQQCQLLCCVCLLQLLLLLQQLLHVGQLSTCCIPVCGHRLFVRQQVLQLLRLCLEVHPHAQLVLLQLLDLLQCCRQLAAV
jgi:hypothetical protein